MDRREFLHSSSIAAIAGAAAGAAAPAAAQTPSAQPDAARDWSQRAPKGEPIVKRFDEQRWVLDNVIQANGIDWDQSHTAVAIRSGGTAAVPDMAELRRRVRRLVDIGPAFEALAKKRETAAVAAERNGDKILARDNYYLACNYWASAMWTIDEVDDKLIGLNKKSARPSTNTRALPIIISNGSSCPIAARRCPRSCTCRRAITKAAARCR